MKRRDFLQISGSVSLPIMLNGFGVNAHARNLLVNMINPENDKILVLIQLNGGNDGLNMLVPIDQYDQLANARANVLVPQNQLLSLNSTNGLHPSMTGTKRLYDQGKVTLLQSVGYPNQNRSHFRSTDIWTTGSPADEVYRTGWMGRYFDTVAPTFPVDFPNNDFPDPFAITIGALVSETCQGPNLNFSIALDDPFSLNQLASGGGDVVPLTPYGDELSFMRTAIAQSNAYYSVVGDAANAGSNTVTYDTTNRLARQLKTVALLISGGLKTKVYVCNLGGFDTHANQVADTTTTGEHAELLKTLGDAMQTFQEDLQGLGVAQRVLGLTFSEFGRRIRSNAASGTDHGTAAPLMLFGNCINPGIIGDNPVISDNPDVEEGVPMQYDFRDVYGTVLEDWFEVAPQAIKDLLHPEYQHLPLLGICTTATEDKERPDIQADNYPNPFKTTTTIRFSCETESVRLAVFDAIGSELAVLVNKRLNAGQHEIIWDARNYAAGTYFFRIQFARGAQKTGRMTKV